MVTLLEESTFTGKIAHSQAMIFSFRRNKEDFAVCWTGSGECDYAFSRRIIRVLNRDGEEIPFHDTHIKIDQSPKYVFLE
jgi:hypothetical protein